MQQHKTAANPNPPKTNQHEENCYKLDGHTSNHCTTSFCEQPTLITASSCRKNSRLYLAGVDPFCSTISTSMLLHCALHWFWSIPNETTGSLQIDHGSTRSLMLFHVIEPWKPLHVAIELYFYVVCSVKTSLVKNRSKLHTTNCYIDFFFGPHCLTKFDCYNLLLHTVTGDYKIIGFKGFIMAPRPSIL